MRYLVVYKDKQNNKQSLSIEAESSHEARIKILQMDIMEILYVVPIGGMFPC